MRGKEEGKIDCEAIVKKAANGDQEAFRLLVDENKNLVYAICLNIVQDSFDAENLAQETFLQVYKSLPKYEFKGFKTWLSRIAVNKAIDYKRRVRSRLENEKSMFLGDMEAITDYGMSVQEIVDIKEEIQLLNECIQKLPEQYVRVLKKCYEEEKSCKEIAIEENISLRTVETRLYRGRKILRECFEEMNKT